MPSAGAVSINSNTTLVKVKYHLQFAELMMNTNSNTTLVKVKLCRFSKKVK